MPVSRILVDRVPGNGAWNMAVDEVLLESAVSEGAETLRLYQWSEPTLSLGYFQSPEIAAGDPRWRDLPVVRRMTGGGAILHDRELTYSLAVPAGRCDVQNPKGLYYAAHAAMIDLLRELGFPVSLRGKADPARSGEFLCFSRGDDFDIVAGNVKVMGSAQRRRKGAVLQHGSLILRRSRYAPEIPGLLDCTGIDISGDRLISTVAKGLGGLLAPGAAPGELTMAEQTKAANLRELRYERSMD